jgi:transposase
MKKSKCSEEQIATALRQVDAGAPIAEVTRTLGPEHLIGDRAYDSDGLDEDLKQDGVNLIAPHCSRRKLKTQDGRHLRRYERCWLVERFFACLQWKRRLLIRREYYASNFLGFVQLACITMLLKQF